jgi:hypothetical protein
MTDCDEAVLAQGMRMRTKLLDCQEIAWLALHSRQGELKLNEDIA